jgi:hypothetical protein
MSEHYETLAVCRQPAHARAVFKEAIAEKPTGRFMIRSHPRGEAASGGRLAGGSITRGLYGR